MPQFTNPYNAQNGIPAIQQPQPMNTGQQMGGNAMWPSNAGPVGNWMAPQPTTTQPSQQPTIMDQQGWKIYSPGPNRSLVGKWVTGFEEIKPQDVPMDGSFAIFPQADRFGNMSCIYAMIWDNNGTIKPYRFLPEMIAAEQPDIQNTQQSDPIKEILTGFTSSMNDRMDALERRIGDILTPFTNQSSKSNKKTAAQKESDAT